MSEPDCIRALARAVSRLRVTLRLEDGSVLAEGWEPDHEQRRRAVLEAEVRVMYDAETRERHYWAGQRTIYARDYVPRISGIV